MMRELLSVPHGQIKAKLDTGKRTKRKKGKRKERK